MLPNLDSTLIILFSCCMSVLTSDLLVEGSTLANRGETDVPSSIADSSTGKRKRSKVPSMYASTYKSLVSIVQF